MSDSNIMSHAVDPVAGHSILAAVDFSEDSKAAVLWACKFADCSESKLIVLHVIHDPASDPGLYHGSSGQLEPLQDVAESMMSDFLAEVEAEQPGLATLKLAELRFVPGLPPRRIVEVAEMLDVSTIVVGSRGVTGLPHMLLGSVAERVVKLSNRPVVVVKSDHSSKPGKKEIKRQLKQEKKERRRLKNWLGLDRKKKVEGDMNG